MSQVISFFLGGILGVVLTCCFVAAGEADDE